MPREGWHRSNPKSWRTLQPAAKAMRRQPTKAEAIMWEALRNNALGVHFRRQHTIDRFITDFCSLTAKLIIEIDGPIHQSSIQQDRERELHLIQMGFQVLRFANDDVLNQLPKVIEDIRRALHE